MLTTNPPVDPALTLGLEVVMLRAPRLVADATWRLRSTEDGIEIYNNPARAGGDEQPAWVSYGMAAEFLVLALHEAALSANVVLGDPTDSAIVARLGVTDSAPPNRLDRALFDAATGHQWPALLALPHAGGEPTAYQRDILMMAAASQRAELVWHMPVAPGHEREAIVSAGDDVADWFSSGRAAAHVMLRAWTLGLTAELVTPSLRQPQLRAALRKELRPPRYPQVLLQVRCSAG